MSQIKTFAKNVDMETCYHDITYLLNETLEKGTLPFIEQKPQAQDTNIISGRHTGDINRTALELKAASIGAKSTMWIFGADAEFLGLELKDTNPKEYQSARKGNGNFNCDPVLMFAKVRERMAAGAGDRVDIVREGASVDVQCAYLLDQFSEASIRRVFRQQKLEHALAEGTVDIVAKRRSEIASQILKNMASHDALRDEKEGLIKANLKNNLRKGGEFYGQAMAEYKKITARLSEAGKVVFDVCRRHYTAQISGSRMELSEADKEGFCDALKTLQKESRETNSPGLSARTIFQASVYAERSSHYGFSLEAIYQKKEMKEQLVNRTAITDPALAREMREASYGGSILNEKSKRQLLNKSHEQVRPQGFER